MTAPGHPRVRPDAGLRSLAPVVALVTPVALVATALALLVDGGAAPLLLSGSPQAVRWLLPLVRAIHDLTAALTVGTLVVTATMLPGDDRRGGGREQRRHDTRAAALRLAAVGAGGWTLSALAAIVLDYSDVAGVSPADPAFGAQLGQFLSQVDLGRALLVELAVAALVCTAAVGVRSRTGVGLTAALSIVGLFPLALAGHAAGGNDHETAVTSLGMHLVGVCIWAGGLGALALLGRRIGDDVPAVVRRYSTLAGWAFALVAISGVINAAVRLGSLAGLATAYGALVLGKAACLLLLGMAGWWHRRRTLPRLADGRTAQFWRLVAAELVVMSVAIGLAVGLARGAPPLPQTVRPDADNPTGYPLPPAMTLAHMVNQTRPDLLWLSVAAVAIGCYLVGVRRLGRRGDRWPWWRTACWLTGCLLLAWVTSGGPAAYGRVTFSGHMLQHMLMMLAVPIPLVLGAPVTLALRTIPARRDGSRGPREWLLVLVHSGFLRAVGHPVVAGVLFAGSLVVFYYSPLFDLALRTHTGHELMHLHFLLVGYLFAWVLVGTDPGPARPRYPLRLVLLFATMTFHAFFGVAILSQTTPLAADWFSATGFESGHTLLQDQRVGGGIAWSVGEIPTLLLAIGVAVAWSRSDTREGLRGDRRAELDGDAELTAYNAHLARLAELDRRR